MILSDYLLIDNCWVFSLISECDFIDEDLL